MTNKAKPTPAQRHAVRVGSARMLRDAREVLKAIREQLPTVPASDHRDALDMTLKAAEEVAATIARHREPDWAAACALLDATERLSVAAAGGWPNPGLMALMFGAHQGLGMARLATHEAERRSKRHSRRTTSSMAAQLRTLAAQYPGLAAYALNRMLPRRLDESTARREVRKVRVVKRVT